jgi:hypothetical protein
VAPWKINHLSEWATLDALAEGRADYLPKILR